MNDELKRDLENDCDFFIGVSQKLSASLKEYKAIHKSDREEIANLEKENFELRCLLAEARGDIETLKKII